MYFTHETLKNLPAIRQPAKLNRINQSIRSALTESCEILAQLIEHVKINQGNREKYTISPALARKITKVLTM